MGVASKLSLPCPFQAKNRKGHGRPNFQAIPFKFSKSIQLLKIFKWYYYDFLIILLVSNFQKNPKAFMSISKGVRDLTYRFSNTYGTRSWNPNPDTQTVLTSALLNSQNHTLVNFHSIAIKIQHCRRNFYGNSATIALWLIRV